MGGSMSPPIYLRRDNKLMDAQVHDTCQGRTKRFVVTNYIRWAFGEFSSSGSLAGYLSFISSSASVDGTVARITDPFEAPILNLDGTHAAVPCIGFNAVELLTFWIHTSLQQLPSR